MFWNKLSLAFQIALVVAAVLVFSFFDPFGLLSPRKKKLQDTPITVTSIREIGQLITAEYFGEVLSSLHEAEVEELKLSDSKTLEDLNSLEVQYFVALKSFVENREHITTHWYSKRKDLTNYFYDENPQLVEHPYYQDMSASLIDIMRKGSTEKDFLKYLYSEKTDTAKIFKLFKQVNIKITATTEIYKSIDKKFNAKLNELTASKKYKRNQMIVLGRGWVRAGFDFGTFNDTNFKYEKEKNTVYLFNMEAKILDCDINPWFIPEKKVKGFEIIAATNRAKSTDYLVRVKQHCLDELRAQAENSGIIAKAHNYAEEALKHFFSLLLDHPLDRVVIMKKSPTDFSNLITDGKIEGSRLKLIDPTLLSLDSIDPGFARQLVKVIKNTTYQSEEKHYDTVNRYSAWVEKISHDGVLTEPELDSLKEIKKSQFTHLDSIWFLNFDSFAKKKSEARKELSDSLYDGKRPINFYFDSIARNENYKTYQKILAKKTDAKMKNVLLTTRDSALQNTVAFLKRRVTKIYQKNTNSTAGQSEYEEVIDSTKRNSLLSSIRE